MIARPSAISDAHELGRDEFGDFGAKTFAVGEALGRASHCLLAREVLAMRDVDHFFSDDPGLGEFVLRDELAVGAGAQRPRRRTMWR